MVPIVVMKECDYYSTRLGGSRKASRGRAESEVVVEASEFEAGHVGPMGD